VLLVSLRAAHSAGGPKILASALVMDLSLAVAVIFIKLALGFDSFLLPLICEGWGLGLAAVTLYIISSPMRLIVNTTLAAMPSRAFSIIEFNELMTVAGKWLVFFAYSIGPAALVSVVGSAQSFFAMIIGYLLTVFWPLIAKEDISNDNVFRKITAFFILVAGLYMIYA